MNNPYKDFVCRTKEILDSLEHKHDVSLLINCAFGLVIFPHTIVLERLQPANKEAWWSDSDFWKQNLKDQDDLPEFLRAALKDNRFPKAIGEFLHKLRNALAHQEFEPKNVKRELVGIKWIIVKAKEGEREVGKDKNIYLELKKDELKSLLRFIANVYLRFLNESCLQN